MSSSADRKITNFPYLTSDEFEDVCQAGLLLFQEEPGKNASMSAKLVKDARGAAHMYEGSTCYLSFQRTTNADLHYATRLESDGSDENENDPFSGMGDDMDGEALKVEVRPASLDRLTIEYDILLSTSYRVPVLYFRIRDCWTQLITDVDVVYNCLVPPVYREQLRAVGIIGGISMTNHPNTDVPSFFVHPCQTAQALMKAAENRQISIDDYLPLWMGIIGASVGLSIPIPTHQSGDAHSGPIHS